MPGVTAWVILNDHPFYRVAHSDLKPMPFTDGIWNRVFKLTGHRLQVFVFDPSGIRGKKSSKCFQACLPSFI